MISMPASKRKRFGFTIVELLVVISIIVLLITLTTGAIMKFRDTGPRTATRSQLKSLKITLDNQWKAVLDKASRETIPATAILGFPLSDPRARANYVSFKLAQAFPTSFQEVFTPGGGLSGYSSYVAHLNSFGITAANVATDTTAPEVQMAVCLMMVAERGPENSKITPESIGTTGAQQLILGNGQRAWGCVDAYPPRPDSVSPTVTQPAGPLLFTRNAGGVPLTPGILSAGGDLAYGVDFVTFIPTNNLQARDNLSPLDP